MFAVLPFVGVATAEAKAASSALTGYDVSYPQCGRSMPAGATFGIVGVTNGLPFSANPCLATEWSWAAARGAPQLYMNTANPAPHSSFYWPSSGASDPALCTD